MIVLWCACYLDLLPVPLGGFSGPAIATLAADRFWSVVFASNASGLVVSTFFVWRAKHCGLVDSAMRAKTRDQLLRSGRPTPGGQRLAKAPASPDCGPSDAMATVAQAPSSSFSSSYLSRRSKQQPVAARAPTDRSPSPVRLTPAAGAAAPPQGAAAAFFFGLEFNPRLPPGRSFDVKMWLYLVGACVLQVTTGAVVSAVAVAGGALWRARGNCGPL